MQHEGASTTTRFATTFVKQNITLQPFDNQFMHSDLFLFLFKYNT